MFLTNHKSNSAADTNARDSAIVFSFGDADAPNVIRFVVVLEPTDPSHSIHALRHFLKSALRNFGLKYVDLKEV
jgi:hypothetical protein